MHSDLFQLFCFYVGIGLGNCRAVSDALSSTDKDQRVPGTVKDASASVCVRNVAET